jgi:hypothetical protein
VMVASKLNGSHLAGRGSDRAVVRCPVPFQAARTRRQVFGAQLLSPAGIPLDGEGAAARSTTGPGPLDAPRDEGRRGGARAGQVRMHGSGRATGPSSGLPRGRRYLGAGRAPSDARHAAPRCGPAEAAIGPIRLVKSGYAWHGGAVPLDVPLELKARGGAFVTPGDDAVVPVGNDKADHKPRKWGQFRLSAHPVLAPGGPDGVEGMREPQDRLERGGPICCPGPPLSRKPRTGEDRPHAPDCCLGQEPHSPNITG